MAIDINKAGAKDIYIAFMSETQRKEALEKKQITKEDLDRVGAPLTQEERKKIFSTISFISILYLVTVASLGKTELELEGLQNDLKELQDFIGQLNNAMSYCTELNGKKDEKDRMFFLWNPKIEGSGLPDTFRKMRIKFGKEIDIGSFFDRNEGGGMNPTKGMSPTIAIEKLRNCSTTIDNKTKTKTVKIQQVNSAYNTLMETCSFVCKKIADAIMMSLQKIS